MHSSSPRHALVDAPLQDPKTPMETLFKVGHFNTGLFLKHPLIRLALATDPRFIGHLIDKKHQRLLVKILRNAEGHGPEFLRKIAAYPNTPFGIHRLIVTSPHLNRQIARRYLRMRILHIAMAQNPVLDATLVRYFAQHKNSGVRIQIAERKDLTDSPVRRLVRDSVHVVRWSLARNCQCPLWALETLAADPLPSIAHTARRTMGQTVCVPKLQEWVSTYR